MLSDESVTLRLTTCSVYVYTLQQIDVKDLATRFIELDCFHVGEYLNPLNTKDAYRHHSDPAHL